MFLQIIGVLDLRARILYDQLDLSHHHHAATTVYLSTSWSVIKQNGRDAFTGAQFDYDPRPPGRLAVAATAPGIAMMTAWDYREPTGEAVLYETERSVLRREGQEIRNCASLRIETLRGVS